MMSPSASLCSSARCLLTHAVGSQVSLVSGFGSSCSQPLLAKRPSQIVGSGRKMISKPPLAAGAVCGVLAAGSCELEAGTAAAATAAVPGTHPSCSTCFQTLSALLNGC